MQGFFSDEPLAVGTVAPDFSLRDQNGEVVALQSFKGQSNIVLIFYPGDSTPGCTKQLCTVRDNWKAFLEKDTLVFGVNGQGESSHAKFIDKYQFPFPLLVDEGKVVCKAYKTNGLLMVTRTVYLIGKDGTIRFSKRGMPEPEEVLAAAE